MNGHPQPIVTQNEETELFELDEEALASVLLRPEVADKHVCVLAIAGAFRKGKTFLLDFLLRYCTNRAHGDDNWLGDRSSELRGFRWRQGYRRETTGILIWSEPFLVTRDDGDEVAVILMDTQGTFDFESSLKDSIVVFALSLLASSVLVYNLMHNVQEDDLTNLQTFINYGTQVLDGSNDSSVYQKLWFLVRDWKHSSDLPYGAQGGQQLLDYLFQVTPQTRQKQLRTDVQKCFEDIACYLMPYPGPQVHENVQFRGKLSELKEQFVDQLQQLVPLLLAPKNLVVKKLGGHAITAKDLFSNFKSYVDVFKSEELPEPMTVAESMAKANSQAALSAALALYTRDMRTFLTVNVAAELNQLEAEHDRMKKEAVNLYQQTNNLGRRNGRIFQEFEKQLVNEITALYNAELKPLASSRSALKAAKEQYVTAMAAVAADGRPAPQMDVLRSKHEVEQERAFHCYRQNNECGKTNDAVYDKYRGLLEKEIKTHYEVELMPPSSSRAALQACKKHYLKAMDAVLLGRHENEIVSQLRVCHGNELRETIEDYETTNEPARKNSDIFEAYLRLLQAEINEAFTDEYLPIAALLDSWNLYIQAMEGAVESAVVLADEDLSKAHDTEEQTAIEHYLAETELSEKNQDVVNEYQRLLKQALEQLFYMIKDINTAKRSARKCKLIQIYRGLVKTGLRMGLQAVSLEKSSLGLAGFDPEKIREEFLGLAEHALENQTEEELLALAEFALENQIEEILGLTGLEVVNVMICALICHEKIVIDAKEMYIENKKIQKEKWLSSWKRNERKNSEKV